MHHALLNIKVYNIPHDQQRYADAAMHVGIMSLSLKLQKSANSRWPWHLTFWPQRKWVTRYARTMRFSFGSSHWKCIAGVKNGDIYWPCDPDPFDLKWLLMYYASAKFGDDKSRGFVLKCWHTVANENDVNAHLFMRVTMTTVLVAIATGQCCAHEGHT